MPRPRRAPETRPEDPERPAVEDYVMHRQQQHMIPGSAANRATRRSGPRSNWKGRAYTSCTRCRNSLHPSRPHRHVPTQIHAVVDPLNGLAVPDLESGAQSAVPIDQFFEHALQSARIEFGERYASQNQCCTPRFPELTRGETTFPADCRRAAQTRPSAAAASEELPLFLRREPGKVYRTISHG